MKKKLYICIILLTVLQYACKKSAFTDCKTKQYHIYLTNHKPISGSAYVESESGCRMEIKFIGIDTTKTDSLTINIIK